jgi:hypothetical protein
VQQLIKKKKNKSHALQPRGYHKLCLIDENMIDEIQKKEQPEHWIVRQIGNGKYENKDTGNGTMEYDTPAVLCLYHEYRVRLKRKIPYEVPCE